MTEVTPYVDLTIFPRINYLKNFDARALRRDLNGRIYGLYGQVQIDNEDRYPEFDGSTCLNGETSFTFDLGPAVTTTPTGVIDLRNDCGIATIIDLDAADIAYTISTSGGDFYLRSKDTVDYTVDWGDGSAVESVSSTNDTDANDFPHTYPTTTTSVSYVIKVNVNSGVYRPYFNNQGDEDQITSIAIGADSAVLGNLLGQAFFGASNMVEYTQNFDATSTVTTFFRTWSFCSSLTSFPLIDTSSGTQFNETWKDNSELTSFPLIDTSNATSLVGVWRNCSKLESFPLIDTSNVTNLNASWSGCTLLEAFPLIDTSSSTKFYGCWQYCSSLTSFPAIDASSATLLRNAWDGCSSLTTFPADVFNSTGNLASNAFASSWRDCALNDISIQNILESLDTNGASGITLGINGGTNASKTTWSTAANTAYNSLITKGWTISYNS